jgi:multiple antibiotic resistance protein
MVLAPAHHAWRAAIPVYTAIVLTGFVTWALLSRSAALQKILGTTGIHVMSRLMGLVLATMAVQFILDGLRAAEVFRL